MFVLHLLRFLVSVRAFENAEVAIKSYMILAIAFVLGITMMNYSCAKLPRPFKEFREQRYENQERRRNRWDRRQPFRQRDRIPGKNPVSDQSQLKSLR